MSRCCTLDIAEGALGRCRQCRRSSTSEGRAAAEGRDCAQPRLRCHMGRRPGPGESGT